MEKYIILAFISALTLSGHSATARETVISTGINTGTDYSNRTYDDDADVDAGLVLPQPDDDSNPPPADAVIGNSRDDEQANIVISPTIIIFTKSTSDSAMLNYKPSISYDLIDDDSNDINHEASAGFQKELTDNWDLKIYDVFKNTDEYETNRPREESLSDNFVEELTSSIPSMNDTLQDEFGSRRYSRNKFSISTGFNYLEGNRISLGYGWDHLQYEEDETDSETYQDYDKYNVNMALSHKINALWTVKGYAQYLRGIYDTNDTSDDDLDEYYLGGSLETDIIQAHPMTLSYDFSETNYDDDAIDNSQIHKLTLGYQLISSPMFDVNLGAGPTYTKLNNSEDSWDANGNLNISYGVGRGSIRLTSAIGTQFDNFSGTDERAITDYWQSRAALSYPLEKYLQPSLYCGYRDETRNEADSDTAINVEQISAGGILKYSINDNYDASLNYDYTVQDSDRSGDSYDEHRIQLILSYKTDLFSL